VHLQLQNLCKVSEDGKDSLIRQALASLPKGLHNTYARISQQIMDQLDYRRSLGIRCLRWVLYAQRPLDVTELQYALATFDEGDNAKDFELDDLDVILGACANLVVAHEEGGYTNDFWLRIIVRPIHYSVQEYFASDGQSLHSPITKLPIGNRMDANARLAADCLAHFYQPMMLSEVSDQFESIDHTGCWLPHDAFLHYAARNFDTHLLATDPNVARRHIDRLLESDSELFRNILNIRALWQEKWLEWGPRIAGAEDWKLHASAIEKWTASSLVAATDFRLFPGLEREHLSQEGLNSALLYACGMTSTEKVRQLLAAGADIHCCDLDGRTPLYRAFLKEDMALLLIQKGARANVKAESSDGSDKLNGGNMLWDAARYRGPRLIRLLLEGGADMNHANPLATAAEEGELENVRCLVEAGADVNSTGGIRGPALHAACGCAHIEVVTYLLDNGADINLKHDRYGSPLCATLDGVEVYAPTYDVFLLLLRRGARVDVDALLSAAMKLKVRELSTILLQLDEGPRYSAKNIRAALIAVQGCSDARRTRDRKQIVIRLLEMRLSRSGNGKKLAVGPDIKALTTSIYEAECEWIGDRVWRRDRVTENDSDRKFDSEQESDNERESDSESDSERGSDGERKGASDRKLEEYRSNPRRWPGWCCHSCRVLHQKQGRPVPRRHRARRVYVWFIRREHLPPFSAFRFWLRCWDRLHQLRRFGDRDTRDALVTIRLHEHG
jgi:ankyrin repeat protein